MRFKMIVSLLVTMLTAQWPARASIGFSFGAPAYELHPQESVIVPLILRFTDADASDLLAQGGLLSAAVRVAQTATSSSDAVTPVTIVPNTVDFDEPILTPILLGPSPSEVGLWEFADITRLLGVQGQESGLGERTIKLGDITFVAGASPGQTVFAAGPYDPTLQTTVTFTDPSVSLDALILPSTLTFTVVPEPGSQTLLLILQVAIMHFGDHASRSARRRTRMPVGS